MNIDRNSCRRRLPGAIAAVGCALALVACGSSGGHTGTGGPSQSAQLVKFAACMRSHGVSGFPDPSTTQGPNSMGIDGYNFNLPSNLNMQSSAAQSAFKTCQSLTGGGGSGHGPPAALVAKARQAALAHARCMRTHGVPNYPDPTISGSGGGVTVAQNAGRGSGMNPLSPAFKRASKDCGPS